MSNVIIELAHPLDAQYAERLGLPAKDIAQGTEVVVTDDVARGLIGAGYAAVEAEDAKAVTRALKRHAPADHEIGLYQAPEDQAPNDGKTADQGPKTNADPGQGTQAAAKRASGK